jgi:hypothetical protein
MTQFCDTHGGHWPETTHTTVPDPVTGLFTKPWIYTIAPYMEVVDSIRICPSDPLSIPRVKQEMTSYTLNGYLLREALPPFNVRKNLVAMSKTIVAIELSEIKDASALGNDEGEIDLFGIHVHSFSWISASNIAGKRMFNAIGNEVALDRHGGAPITCMPMDTWI